jgi:hypothetical protein
MSQYEHCGDRLDYAGRVYARGELLELDEAEGARLIASGLPVKKVSPDQQAEPEAPAEVK